VAAQDAPLVSRLRQAGAIILGVTNTPELLMAWETDNLLYGRTNSPWDLSRTPGGSSGGRGGRDCRRHVGRRSGQRRGRIDPRARTFQWNLRAEAHARPHSCEWAFSGFSRAFRLVGVVGPMARTVADLKALFQAMQGPDDGDPSAAPVPVRWPEQHDLKGIRIGYFEDDGRTPVTAETRAAVQTAAEGLQHAGFRWSRFSRRGSNLPVNCGGKYSGSPVACCSAP